MIYPDIDPVALSLGPIKVHWYGISYMVAFLLGWWLARFKAAKLPGWNAKQVDDLLFYAVIGVILGGRFGYILFYGFNDWLDDPLRLFRVWEGGMSFHGGLIGVLVAMFLFAKKTARSFFEVTDFIAPIVPVGLFTGRIGNFINGELWGGPASVPWGVQVPCERFYHLCASKLQLPAGTELTPALHPSQLYEATLEGLLLFAILWLIASRQPPKMVVSGTFLLLYGLFRSVVELVRMPDAHIGYLWADWLTMGQLLSLPMIVIGGYFIYLGYKSNRNFT